MAGVFTLEDLARHLNVTLVPASAGAVQVRGLATLAAADSAQVAFVASARYLEQLATTGAAAVILAEASAAACPVPRLIAEDPYLAFAHASQLFANLPEGAPGIHPTAIVDATAQVHPSASIGPRVCIGAGTTVAAGAHIGAGVTLGRAVCIGASTRIYPNAVLYDDVHVGTHCIIHSQAVLGADGFGFARGPDGWHKIAQLGGVRIGDRVEIGACTTVDRGTLEHTIIEDGVIIDNQVQIGHNCRVGKNTAIAGCSGLAGSTTIGANCTLAGAVGVVGHIEICDNVHIAGQTRVTKSINEPGAYCSGTPMLPLAQWKRNAARFGQLDRISRRLARLWTREDGSEFDQGS